MALPVGNLAPDFTLKTKTDAGLEDVSLGTFRGKQAVVLLFVPGAFTGVCTQELCDATAGLGNYQSLNATVLAISVDNPFAQEVWAKANGFGMPLLSDYAHTVTQAYDVVLPDLAGLGPGAKRAAFVIDREGVIQYSEATPTPSDMPNFTALQAKLAEIA